MFYPRNSNMLGEMRQKKESLMLRWKYSQCLKHKQSMTVFFRWWKSNRNWTENIDLYDKGVKFSSNYKNTDNIVRKWWIYEDKNVKFLLRFRNRMLCWFIENEKKKVKQIFIPFGVKQIDRKKIYK